MWYGLAAVRQQHMPGQCTLSGKDEMVVVRKRQQMRKSGAVSRHQRDATADDLLALLNSVIAGAVFSESMLASAYIGCEAMYAAEEARHDGGSCSWLRGSTVMPYQWVMMDEC